MSHRTRVSWQTWVQMMRPGFLVITVVACVLGTSVAWVCAHFVDLWLALITMILALLMHAAANVLNDYHDALNGADDANTQGLFPFTGGSRLIQSGRVSVDDTHRLAKALWVCLIPCGVLLALDVGTGLIGLGLAGLLLAWGYSAPPLALMMRGLGEFAVALSWGLVVVGADYVQRGEFSVIPVAVALSYALLIGNILIINGFPDAPADAQVGKRTLVVRLGPRRAAAVYVVLSVCAYVWLWGGVQLSIHPRSALWGMCSMPFSVMAVVLLLNNAEQPQRLTSAIVWTIVTAVVHGLTMSAGLWFDF